MAEVIDILVVGGHGQVGQALQAADKPQDVRLRRPTRAELDGSDVEAVARVLRATRARAILNLAAFTNVDAAERQAGAAFLTNAVVPARLGDAARDAGIPLVHLSTDFVFDGRLGQPYREEDATAPLSVYGASKRAGELAALSAGCRATVVRTAGVFSRHGTNVLTRLLTRASAADTLAMVSDRWTTPTSADDLALALMSLIRRQVADAASPGGLYHCANAGEASWFDFARLALRDWSGRVVPTPVAALTEVAARPRDSRLCCDRLAQDHGLVLRPWQDALAQAVGTRQGLGRAS